VPDRVGIHFKSPQYSMCLAQLAWVSPKRNVCGPWTAFISNICWSLCCLQWQEITALLLLGICQGAFGR